MKKYARILNDNKNESEEGDPEKKNPIWSIYLLCSSVLRIPLEI